MIHPAVEPRKSIEQGALALAALVALATGCAPGERAETAVPPGLTVIGSVQEGYSGSPLGTGEAVLMASHSYTILHRAPVDPDGRFRFEELRDLPASGLVGWKSPDDSEFYAERARTAPIGDDVPLPSDSGGTVDLGTVRIWQEENAVELFAPACSGERVPPLPFTGFEMFRRANVNDAYRVFRGGYGNEFRNAFPTGWSGVLCITETAEKVGTYEVNQVGTDGTSMVPREAYDLTWDVRLVRMPEGDVLDWTVRTSPPEKISFGRNSPTSTIVTKNPTPLLLAWLRQLE